jgi:hypothetical protein
MCNIFIDNAENVFYFYDNQCIDLIVKRYG